MMRRACGFTLVELVTIMILVGILAAVAIPRMDTSAYHATRFHDQTVAALRFAQKTAVSHRRPVQVSFPDSTYTLELRIDTDRTGNWRDLVLPGAASHKVTSTDPANTYFAPASTAWAFAPDGTAADCTTRAGGTCIVNIKGAASITVVGATGYVK